MLPHAWDRAALVVGHPGHELRLLSWLEAARPLVCVITDGSGGSGRSRIASSFDLLAATGSSPGPVMGAFSDAAIYEAIMQRDVAALAEATETIAAALVQHDVRSLVSDAIEFYNPTHDLCSIVASFAAAKAESMTGTAIARFDYALTLATGREGIVLNLDDDAVARKIAAAYHFDNLTADVNDLLGRVGRADLAREILCPMNPAVELPIPVEKPAYETFGEERVKAGRYRTVLRFESDFVPFVEALAKALGCTVAVRRESAARV